MPTPVAFLLNRPSRTFSLFLKGASGSSVLLSSIAAPAPLAHQWSGLMPHAMNSVANRLGHGAGTSPAIVAEPQTGTDSSHGRAIATPVPRRNARRETEALFCALIGSPLSSDYPSKLYQLTRPCLQRRRRCTPEPRVASAASAPWGRVPFPFPELRRSSTRHARCPALWSSFRAPVGWAGDTPG